MRASIAAVLVVAMGCAPKPASEPGFPKGAITTAYSAAALRNDSTLRRIVALEDTLRRDSTSAETPRRLYQLGRMIAKDYTDLGLGTADTAFKVGRDSMYWYNEVGGGFLYMGQHFKEIERRFPRDTFAVLAAWELAWLPQGGECEGYIPCMIFRGFMPMDEFVRKHPHSRLASTAVDSANSSFQWSLHWADSMKVDSAELDLPEVRKHFARYDSTLALLPDSLRARGYRVLLPWVEKHGDPAQASAIRAWMARRGR